MADDSGGRGGVGNEDARGAASFPAGAAACPFHEAAPVEEADRLRGEATGILRENAVGHAHFREAEKLLLGALELPDAHGTTHHLLGLTYFHLESWDEAQERLAQALLLDPGNAEARHLLARAEINARTRVDRSTDVSADFSRAKLLQPPALWLTAPTITGELPPPEKKGVVALLVGLAGGAAGLAIEGLIAVAYRLRKRKTVFAFESWDERGALFGKLELAGWRHMLNRDKLQSTYEGLVGYQQPGQRRPEWTRRFRTATGAWTTDDPMEGAAGTEIQRTGSPLSKRTNRADDRSLPSARQVSRFILAQEPGRPRREVPFLNLLTIAWIQPQLHDWVSHRPTPVEGVYTVPLEPDDPLRVRYGIGVLHVSKSAPNPIPQRDELTYLSEVTHWWDASHIYGSDQATQDRLRVPADGKLRIDEKTDLLPLNPHTHVEDTGFTRNWWIGPDLFHTLFVKHHNHICEVLKKAHPSWSSDQLFHTARLVNAAILAKIHTVEWTPAALPNRKIVAGMGANWWGLIEQCARPFAKRRIRRWYEPVHEVLGGIVGGKRDNHAKPYGLTEEFVEIYRLHAGIPEAIRLLALDGVSLGLVPTDGTRGVMARHLMQEHGMPILLNSFGHQHMPALVHNNYPEFMSGMSVDGQAVVDLGTIDILRARERGVPPYNEFRRMLGLAPIGRFEDLGCSAETVRRLELLYGEGKAGIERVDLLAGTCCELWRPENFGFGETLFTVFVQMASRRLQADPFFTEKLNARYYSEEGMALIEEATLKGILLHHYPGLAHTGLSGVSNAFEPWGTTANTDPDEHPLAHIERY